MPEDRLAPLPAGSYYQHQLVGCAVETTAGQRVGAVKRVDGGIAGSLLAVEGERDQAYSEAQTSAYMKRDEIRIRADIGLGRGKATVWTCDLTKEYVAINGDYRS